MDKKTILAFVIIGIIIILWPVYEEKVLGIKRAANRQTIQQSSAPAPASETTQKEKNASTLNQSGSLFEKSKQKGKSEKSDILTIETDLFRGLLSSEGGGTVISWKLKKFLNPHGNYVELIPDSAKGNLGIVFSNQAGNQVDLSGNVFQVLENSQTMLDGREIHKIVFSKKVDGIGRIEKEWIVEHGTYDVQLRIRLYSTETSTVVRKYQIHWKSGISPTEKKIRDESTYVEAVALQGDEMLKPKSGTTGLREGSTAWAAVRNKYFLISMIPVGMTASATELKSEKIQVKDFDGNSGLWKHVLASLTIPLAESQYDTSRIILYLGPVDYHLLKAHHVLLEKNMNFGWTILRPFSIAFMYTLEFLYKIVRNYGWAIIIFAILIKLLMHPLTKKSMDSMKKMQALQPKIQVLREKYKNDPQKLNAETMKLYKTQGINPLGGCLPVILQMPVLFALFNLFRMTIMLRQAPFLGIINDLSAPDRIIRIGHSAVNILPIFMSVSMIIQQRLTVQDPKQKFTTYFMSVFMIYIFYNLSAGLNLYYLIFNVLQIAQELYIRNKKPKTVVEG
jgi:YidC/Oxa1 family membrane protein insertase